MNMPAAPSQLVQDVVRGESILASSALMPLSLGQRSAEWLMADPFPHLVIDDFFHEGTARHLAAAVPEFDASTWHLYNSPIERKRTLNAWDRLPPEFYKVIWELCSPAFVAQLETLTRCRLYPDFGLHGGGIHSHTRGGNLNVHMDYSLHPKLRLERRLNLIVYLTPDWNPAWGGSLELWDHDWVRNQPRRMKRAIEPVFNRAVLFDTTCQSWHGLPDPLSCPEGVCRNSLAVYYLCDPRHETSGRGRALFAPHRDQYNDESVLELIRRRSSVEHSHEAYRT
jgi:hypothetical protein